MSYIPAEMSITELAAVLGVDRRMLKRRIVLGLIPGRKMGGKWIVPMATLRLHYPEIWDGIVMRKHIIEAGEDAA